MNDEEYIQHIQKYSLSQLVGALDSVDKEKHPKRFMLLKAQIEDRKRTGEAINQAARNSIWTEPVSWSIALTVWWAFAWRSFLFFLLVYVIAMIPVGLLSSRGMLSPRGVAVFLQLIFLIISCIIGIIVMRTVLSKKSYGDFLVFVVPNKDSNQALDPTSGNARGAQPEAGQG